MLTHRIGGQGPEKWRCPTSKAYQKSAGKLMTDARPSGSFWNGTSPSYSPDFSLSIISRDFTGYIGDMDFDVKTRRWLLVFGVAGCALGIWSIGFALSKVEEHRKSSRPPFNPKGADIGTPLVEFPVVAAEEAPDSLSNNSLVIGVQINGKARAYPLNALSRNRQHVINDELGGVPIVVTWSMECFNGRVFDRHVDNRTLEFYAADNRWNDSLVILDSETKTYWSQLMGEALHGPEDGRELEPIVCEVLSWEGWLNRFPETTVVDLPVIQNGPTAAGLAKSDDLAFGAVIDGHAVHWSMEVLRKSGGVSCTFRDKPLLLLINSKTNSVRLYSRKVENKTLRFEVTNTGRFREMGSQSVWDPVTMTCVEGALQGKRLRPVVGTLSRVGKWKVFYPKSTELDDPND